MNAQVPVCQNLLFWIFDLFESIWWYKFISFSVSDMVRQAEKKEGRKATVTDTFQFALPTKSKSKQATGQTHSKTLV